MTVSTTPQVDFWLGEFGNAYTDRNAVSTEQLRARVALWSEIMSHMRTAPPASILEVGANIGINLRALRALSAARLYAVEPNDMARDILVREQVVAADDLRAGFAAKIDFPDRVADLVFTSGVLIHIHPDHLLASVKEIQRCSAHWIACIEYFSDKPEMIPYRGYDDRLFKRDFGSYWLNNFPDLRTVACGFAWKQITGLDNLTWWLFEKL